MLKIVKFHLSTSAQEQGGVFVKIVIYGTDCDYESLQSEILKKAMFTISWLQFHQPNQNLFLKKEQQLVFDSQRQALEILLCSGPLQYLL